MEENKKKLILVGIAIITLLLVVVGATYAYFVAQGGDSSSKNVTVTTDTTDSLTFNVTKAMSITADETSFAKGKGNAIDTTTATASLIVNSAGIEATYNYNLFFIIEDNNFEYTTSEKTAELILTVTDPEGNPVTEAANLNYVTVGGVSGFDVTTKNGGYLIAPQYEIKGSSGTINQEWNVTLTLVNLDSDQTANAGKVLRGKVYVTKENYTEYNTTRINTVATTSTKNSINANLNYAEGTANIDKYYFKIEETNGAIALNEPVVRRLSNKIAATGDEYIESETANYTFTGLKEDTSYKISSYVKDKNGINSNTYEATIITDGYNLPKVNDITVNRSETEVDVTVTGVAGEASIKEYYYSIDGGKSWTPSSTATHKFSNLNKTSDYTISVKIKDANDRYSTEYTKVAKAPATSAKTFANYIKGLYTTNGVNNLYLHDKNLENSAEDNSIRYAGSSETTNNFVCFASDAETCENDDLYRIIGVFGDQVKLIKYDYANSNMLGTDGDYNTSTYSKSSSSTYKGSLTTINRYYWNYKNDTTINSGYGSNNWETSLLNKTNLNTNYITYLNNRNAKWAKMIADTKWNIGGHTTSSATAKTLYNAEITKQTSETSKIGLMQVSDYGYATLPSNWSTNLGSYDTTGDNNWMYMGLNEWTITPDSSISYNAYKVNLNGNVNINNAYFGFAGRPVLYLKADVAYVKGNGSRSEPYRINL